MIVGNSKKSMKAAQGKDYGDIDEMLSVEDAVAYPSLENKKNFMIIKTHAVALACGDCRVLSGLTKVFQGPPKFPYIPGADCCGVVAELPDETDCPFRVGDRVAVRFAHGPRDALAEYALVKRVVCAKVPKGMSSVDAAALAGACPSTLLAERILSTANPGVGGDHQQQRILIMGAGGGMGSHLCQTIRTKGGGGKNFFIVGVSQTPERLLADPLLYDQAIDYTKENPFAIQEFKDNPFDVVVDLAGVGSWLHLNDDYKKGVKSIVKPASLRGRFLTTTPDKAIFKASSLLNLFLFVPIWRAVKSRLWARSRLPKYTFAMSLEEESTHLERTLEMGVKGDLKAVVHSRGPFPFTTEGVRKAFRVQESRHGHGKVVIQVAKEEQK